MSEANGPYKYKFGPFSSARIIGPGVRVDEEKIRLKHLKSAWIAGRASRDGLARALNDILEGGNDTSAWAFGVAKRALEADGGYK